MRSYATYAYYTDEYAGDELTETEFTKYAKKASVIIDNVTFQRIQSMAEEEIPSAVREAVCAVAELLRRFDAEKATDAQGRVIASENNDGFAVSFRDTGTPEARSARNAEVFDTIRTYLAATGLMFRGVGKHDYRNA